LDLILIDGICHVTKSQISRIILTTLDYRVTLSHSDFALECHCRCL